MPHDEMVEYTFVDDETVERATPFQRLVRALWGYWKSARSNEYSLVRHSS
jgi:hypothetical protein